MRLAEAFVEILRDEGVDRVFGNPGTTELPLVDALAKDGGLPYVLGAHEGPVVAMADGYARATGRPAFVSLHVAAGHRQRADRDAQRAAVAHPAGGRSPASRTAGTSSRTRCCPATWSGWRRPPRSGRSRRAAPTRCRRCCAGPSAPPSPRRAGPVFVSVPMDLFDEDAARRRSPRDRCCEPVAPGLRTSTAAAKLLRAAGTPAVVAGDGVGRGGAVDEAGAGGRGARRGRPTTRR